VRFGALSLFGDEFRARVERGKDSGGVDVSFVLVTADMKQKEIPLKKALQVFGRGAEANIRIPDPGVSRRHCEVSIEDGVIRVKDLGSSNGTYVNQKKVTEATVKANDLVAVGPFVFVVRVDGEPEEIDSEEALEDGAPPKAGIASPPTAKKSLLDDEDDLRPPSARGKSAGNDDSDEFDSFDFKDDDAPKL
jgi:predicted component of type VI protein secretion system